MRCLVSAVSLGLCLILVGAAPVPSLRKDMKTAAEETQVLITQTVLNSLMTAVKFLIDNDVGANQTLIDEWQQFYNEWQPRIESLPHDEAAALEIAKKMLQMALNMRDYKADISESKRVAFNQLKLRRDNEIKDLLSRFGTKATKIMQDAKDAGNTDEELEERFNQLVNSDDEYWSIRLILFLVD